MITFGHDPGKQGAIVLLNGLDVIYQRTADGPNGYIQTESKQEPNPASVLQAYSEMAEALIEHTGTRKIDRAVTEIASWYANTQLNAGVAGRMGMDHMAWRMLLTVYGIPYEVLTGNGWRKRAGITIPTKRKVLKPDCSRRGFTGEYDKAAVVAYKARVKKAATDHKKALKQASILHVSRLLPGLDLTPDRFRVPHDGLADAAGMAIAAGRS